MHTHVTELVQISPDENNRYAHTDTYVCHV